MQKIAKTGRIDITFTLAIVFMIVLSVITLDSIAPDLFPLYFLYIALGFVVYFLFLNLDFEIISLFSRHLYILSIFLLILPLIVGQITRGTIRWIPVGALTVQPAEIVRPFLFVFFSSYLIGRKIDAKVLLKTAGLLLLPVALILIQPSLGVSVLTVVGFVGIVLAAGFPKKYYAIIALIFVILLPAIWFLMQGYQRSRITSFLHPASDPYRGGYNSIQAMISVGSGKIFGRGLGKGTQTQLAFLPEKHSDFIFAAVAEEMGFLGAATLIGLTIFLLFKLINILENVKSPKARAFMSGLLLTFLVQVLIHIGMNMGLLPITGLPYPLVSAGGSSLLATMASLGIAQTCKKKASS